MEISHYSVVYFNKRWGTRQANEILKESRVRNAKEKGKTE